jgi:hypothetical protein
MSPCEQTVADARMAVEMEGSKGSQLGGKYEGDCLVSTAVVRRATEISLHNRQRRLQ